ncbi:MAG: amino acid adenylation domain-containing protein [Solirubrobacterales bacterium]
MAAGLFTPLPRPFEAQAAQSAGATALVGEGGPVSYAELEERSGRVARWLSGLGIGRDDLVAICATRSPELIAGLLGVLRAGAAYLPIDPMLPMERVSTLLRASRAPLLLSDAGARGKLPGLGGVSLTELTAAGQRLGEGQVKTLPSDLAYVIYTSGSTGEPKGVMCTHAGIDNRLRWMQRRFELERGDVVLHKTSIGFDVSVWEIFWPLSEGARLALAPPGAERDPELLGDFIRAHEVTVAHFVPAMLRMFVRSGEARRTPSLRLVACSGEALFPQLRDEFLAQSDARLHNLYGPTEASIDVTHHACRRGEPARAVPIGRPIDGVRVHVLDEERRPVPPGGEGEIHLGGVALARGYHGRPDLTAAAFVPDPFEPGERLYRTGDRGRWRSDGELEYLGRRDDQVKVRGVRIELGEVEATLATLAGVRECAVLQLDGSGGGLVGFVDEGAPEAGKLRRLLGRQLPDAAVPTRFVYLPAVPRLPSGKPDRAALRKSFERERIPFATGGGRTKAERILAGVWREVLRIEEEEIGADANFFALGGDSIRSIEVVFRCREEGLELTTQDVFRWQTLAAIAAAGSGAAERGTVSARRAPFGLLPAEDRKRLPAGVVDAFPLSSLLRGLMAEAATNPSYRLYTTTLTLRGRYDRAALERALRELTHRHPILRSSLEMERFTRSLQVVFAETVSAVTEVDARGVSEDDWPTQFGHWIEEERRTPLEPSRPPLFRLTVHRRRDRFFLTFTEPYLDGWSATVVLTELLSLYEAELGGSVAPLPPPSEVSMVDLVGEERELLTEGSHRDAWQQLLAGAEEAELPRLTGLGDALEAPLRLSVPVSSSTSQRLAELARELEVPLKTVLLAAHARVVAALSGREDVVCGLMVNGRPEARGGERAAGMFLNVVPLRIGAVPGSWVELIEAVHGAEAEALPWRRYPYQRLLGDLGGRALFDTVFNFTRFRPYAEWSGEEVELLEVDGTDQTYFRLTAQASVGLRGEVRCALEFNPDGFSRRQVDQIVALYARTLEQIAASPRVRHELAPLVAAGEGTRAGPEATVPSQRLEALLEQRIVEEPEAIAFVEESGRCTYADLGRDSELTARRILEAGGGSAPARVGVCMRRSAGAVAAMLAALRLGAAFVPLDPASPSARLAAILADAAPEVVFTDGAGARALPPFGGPVLRGEGAAGPGPSVGDPAIGAAATPDDPAHVLYTSGSTGSPRGVITPHGPLLNRLRWMAAHFPAREGELYCASGAIGFVDSITSLFSGLFEGVPVFVPPDPLPPPRRFATLLHDAGVTRVTMVPAFLRDLLAELGEEAGELLGGIGLWVLSGEPLAVELVQSLRRFAPEGTVLNLYGSTEVAGDVTAHVCSGEEQGPLVPAGAPIDGVRIQVLDRHGRELPLGAAGELVVSGAAPAAGYVGGEARGSERFRRSPMGKVRFHTGDLGRLRPDGELELVGRADQQLKLNGVRVEPAEIEAALCAHPGVREAAVTTASREGKLRLVAYVNADADGRELRAFLAGRLPSALVPAAVLPVAELPRTQSGKIDHGRLAALAPPPDGGSPVEDSPRPASDTERALQAIWSEVLDREEVSLDEDFFALGGDSLRAVRVLACTSERLGARMGLRELFDYPTVRACAARIDAAGAGTGDGHR